MENTGKKFLLHDLRLLRADIAGRYTDDHYLIHIMKVVDKIDQLLEEHTDKAEQPEVNPVVRELNDRVQFLVDQFVNTPEGCFTFPDGDTWWKTGKSPRRRPPTVCRLNPEIDTLAKGAKHLLTLMAGAQTEEKRRLMDRIEERFPLLTEYDIDELEKLSRQA